MSQGMAWLLLIVSGLLDVAWAIAMKYAEGYTRTGWTVLSVVLLIAFVYLLGRVLEILPVGTAYAVWTGIGAAGTVLLGIVLFGEAINPMRLGGVTLIVIGIVALKFAPA
ncbi:quaternary ammonium compound-resistance protein SugE [Ochrobactrum daejeonense]|uniref:Guanidinium exporter n=1 Tax=Brucella daejeonensis TaxID=659015 RepID=A0A7W9AUK4_9HYPH|nr:multidrug efflux SMR transporter [Brucella daejeonensis]MBB5700716.1 quaternary ammonium compound-resistance protein SugE [Brucella daejeonensis]NKB79399.1 multidrug efflux SMR transporter [Brucella daejeonensis]